MNSATSQNKGVSSFYIHGEKPLRFTQRDVRDAPLTTLGCFIETSQDELYKKAVRILYRNVYGTTEDVNLYSKEVEDYIFKLWMEDKRIYEAGEAVREYIQGIS